MNKCKCYYDECVLCNCPINVRLVIPESFHLDFVFNIILSTIAHPFIGNPHINSHCLSCHHLLSRFHLVSFLSNRSIHGVHSIPFSTPKQFHSLHDINLWWNRISRISNDSSCNWSNFSLLSHLILFEHLDIYYGNDKVLFSHS